MSRHWKEKTVLKSKNGTIVKRMNVSGIFNDVDYYVLFDGDRQFVDKGIDFNLLKNRLYAK